MKTCQCSAVILYGRQCLNCKRQQEKTLDQLECESCGKTYHEPALKADEFRWKSVCNECRPKPKFMNVKMGPLVIKGDL